MKTLGNHAEVSFRKMTSLVGNWSVKGKSRGTQQTVLEK